MAIPLSIRLRNIKVERMNPLQRDIS
jgi:hypothetical protein